MARWKTIGATAGSLLGAVLLLLLLARLYPAQPPASRANPWNSRALEGSLAGVKARQIDAADAAVIFSYDLKNNTGTDFRMENSPHLIIMSRLLSGNSVTSDRPISLGSSVFVPAEDQTRITLEVHRPFAWPLRSDADADAKLRQLVQAEVAGLDGFVLFDDATHYQINLPGGWPQPQQASVAPAAN